MEVQSFSFDAATRADLLRILVDPQGVDDIEDACRIWLDLPLPNQEAAETYAKSWRRVHAAAQELAAALGDVDLYDVAEYFATRSRFNVVRELAFRGKGQRSLVQVATELSAAVEWGRWIPVDGAKRPEFDNLWVLAMFVTAVCMRLKVCKQPSANTASPYFSVMSDVFTALGEKVSPRYAIETCINNIKTRGAVDMFATRDERIYIIQKNIKNKVSVEYSESALISSNARVKRRGGPYQADLPEPLVI
ncbi:MAG: hypothetical protein IPG93_24730 [Burkholderiales bacterium]|nr:hypothetical protein [Burkholderiales bacterium]